MGARFEAPDELVFMAPSEIFGIFFATQMMPFEHCDAFWTKILNFRIKKALFLPICPIFWVTFFQKFIF